MVFLPGTHSNFEIKMSTFFTPLWGTDGNIVWIGGMLNPGMWPENQTTTALYNYELCTMAITFNVNVVKWLWSNKKPTYPRRWSEYRTIRPIISIIIFYFSGCTLLSSQGLCGLTQLRNLEELELTNCPSASKEIYLYLKENMHGCLVLD